MKFKLIKERIPEKSFKFPGKEYKDRKRKDGTYTRYCNREWLTEFSFLSYSKVKDGLYCLSCVLFLTGSSTQHAHLLISTPYRNWKDARADMLKHSALQYRLHETFFHSITRRLSNKSGPICDIKCSKTNSSKLSNN